LVLMVISWLVPFLVHLIPWNGEQPLGTHLLPVFWTTFVAVYYFGLWAGLAVALVTPALNLVFTGLPAAGFVASMTLELVAFVAIAAWTVKRWPSFWLAAPLAFLPAKAIAIAVRWAVPVFAYHRDPLEHWVGAMQTGLAGLVVLLFVNLVVIGASEPDSDWDTT
jgi:hypothetical protein